MSYLEKIAEDAYFDALEKIAGRKVKAGLKKTLEYVTQSNRAIKSPEIAEALMDGPLAMPSIRAAAHNGIKETTNSKVLAAKVLSESAKAGNHVPVPYTTPVDQIQKAMSQAKVTNRQDVAAAMPMYRHTTPKDYANVNADIVAKYAPASRQQRVDMNIGQEVPAKLQIHHSTNQAAVKDFMESKGLPTPSFEVIDQPAKKGLSTLQKALLGIGGVGAVGAGVGIPVGLANRKKD